MGTVRINVEIRHLSRGDAARMRSEATPGLRQESADLILTITGAQWQVIERLELLRDSTMCPAVKDAAERRLAGLLSSGDGSSVGTNELHHSWVVDEGI